MRQRRRRRPKISIPTTSMGDIAFLLIIFFIICSHETKKAGISVTPPTAPALANLPKPRIYVAIDANDTVYFDGRPVGGAGEVESEIFQRLARLDANSPVDARTVVFDCDRTVKKETFEPVLEAIAKGGGIIGAVGREGTTNKP